MAVVPALTRRHFTGLALATLPTMTARAATPLIYAVGVDPAYTPIFVAGERKLFQAGGQDVQVQQFSQGGDALDSVVAGQATFAGAADSTVITRMARAQLRGLAIYEESGRYIKLVARKGITEAGQIRKLGIVPGTVSEYCAGLLLQKLAPPAGAVELVRSGPPELPALLVRGDIDAVFVWEPWPSMAVKQGGNILMTSGDVGYAYTMWITVTAAWLHENEPVAHKVVAALAQACEMVRADPTVGAAAVQAQARLPAAQTLGFLQEVDCRVRDFTPADITAYERIANFLAERKITTGVVDIRGQLLPGFFQG